MALSSPTEPKQGNAMYRTFELLYSANFLTGGDGLDRCRGGNLDQKY
jgi:hypothetical protein